MLPKLVERGRHAVLGDVMRCPGCKCLVTVNSYQEHVFFCLEHGKTSRWSGPDMLARILLHEK